MRGIVAAGHVRLVETLAERIAEACLADRRVHLARVRVEKLDIFAGRGIGRGGDRAAAERLVHAADGAGRRNYSAMATCVNFVDDPADTGMSWKSMT